MAEISVPPELRAVVASSRLVRVLVGVTAAGCLAVAIPLCLIAIGLPWLPSLARHVPPSQLDAIRLVAGSVGVGLILIAVLMILVAKLVSGVVGAQEREFMRVVSTVAPRRARIEIQWDYQSEFYRARLFLRGQDQCLREFFCSANWDADRINGEEVETYVSSDPDDIVAVKTSRGWLWSAAPLRCFWPALGRRTAGSGPPG